MAVSADIYRERSGNVTKIATNVTPPFTDSDNQEGDKYYVVPTGEQPVVLEIPPNISGFSVSNPSGQDVQITFDSDEQLGTNASDLSVEISGAETDVMARSDFTESGTGPYTYTGTYAGASDGSYTATLQVAKDPRGNDGATGESDSVSVSTDSTPPTVSNFSAANPSGQDVEVSFDSDEQLGSSSGDIDVGISGAESGSLSRGDFTESGTGPYTYTATYAGASDGDYTATLNAAKDSAGNDGASGQSSTVSVDTTAPSISSFLASNPSGQDVEVSFDSDEQLGGSSGDIDVGISGAESGSLARGDFSESGTGPYTYTATYAGSSDGDYTATLNAAKDPDGNDGASSQSDTVTVGQTGTTGEPVVASYDPAAQEVTWVSGDAPKNAAYDDSTQEITWQFSPAISAFSATNPTAQDVEVSFESSTQLGSNASDLEVSIGGAETATLTRSDFTESGTGPYTYTATYSGSTSGEYNATLIIATAADGSPLSSGQRTTLTI